MGSSTQSVLSPVVPDSQDSAAVPRSVPLFPLVLALVAVLSVQATWYYFDVRVPSTDEAGHILNALQYKELLRHCYFWKQDWLVKFLSVNPFYPPAVYIYDGFLKLLFGNARAIDNLCWLSYLAVLTASTYGIAWQVTARWQTAFGAALLINLYPQIANLSHLYLLDLPLVAAVGAGLCLLLWWQSQPTWPRTFAAAVVLVLACMTKQLGAAYLIPPCVYLLVVSRNRAKLVAMGAIVASVLLPWLIVNIGWIKNYASENAANMQGVHLSPLAVFFDYCLGLVYSLSPSLTVALAVALFFLSRQQHKRLSLLYSSAVGGLILTSLLSCTFPLDRYAAPALVVSAVATACGVRQLWLCNRNLGTVFSVVFALLALVQYASFCFTPIPLAVPWLDGCGKVLHTELREFRGVRITKSPPVNTQAWGQSWVVDTIAKVDSHTPVWLNILPSQGIFNPHSFELISREKGAVIQPTTSRYWTIMGDKVEFLPESALYYHWYLLKSGDQGNQFKDESSAQNYEKLIQFVRTSGHFRLVGKRLIADGSTLELYRQF